MLDMMSQHFGPLYEDRKQDALCATSKYSYLPKYQSIIDNMPEKI